eukprot:1810828-Amphidinium_carterae.1
MALKSTCLSNAMSNEQARLATADAKARAVCFASCAHTNDACQLRNTCGSDHYSSQIVSAREGGFL